MLTIVTAFFSNTNRNVFYVTIGIMLLSGVKFLLVAFNFMELKKANVFWKILLSIFLALFIAITLVSSLY